jgi:hypothetical protein
MGYGYREKNSILLTERHTVIAASKPWHFLTCRTQTNPAVRHEQTYWHRRLFIEQLAVDAGGPRILCFATPAISPGMGDRYFPGMLRLAIAG